MSKLDRYFDLRTQRDQARRNEYDGSKAILLGATRDDSVAITLIKMADIGRPPDASGLEIDLNYLQVVTKFIQEHGIILPLVIREMTPRHTLPCAATDVEIGKGAEGNTGQVSLPSAHAYELVAGYAYFAALQQLDIEMAPCNMRVLSDAQAAAAFSLARLSRFFAT